MDVLTADTFRRPEAQAVAEYRVDRSLQTLSRYIENELHEIQRNGPRVTTIHPDTGTIALSQEYSDRDAHLDLTHRDAPDGDGYITEIYISGDKDRVEELEDTLTDVMGEL